MCETESLSPSAGSKCDSQTPDDLLVSDSLFPSRSKHLTHVALDFNSNLSTKSLFWT